MKNNLFLRLKSIWGRNLYPPVREVTQILWSPVFCLSRNIISPPLIAREEIIDIVSSNRHVFFGYYDVTPFDWTNKLLLAMRVPLAKKSPDIKDFAEVGYYRLDDSKPKFNKLGETNTWCWQQGCRLQWYPQNGQQIIYNCLVDGKYGAVVKKVPDGDVVKKINKPLYSISSDGKWGLSLDFSRLQRLRPGYGYGILPDKSAGEFVPENNGIELVNLEKNKSQQLFSLKEIAKIKPHGSMKNAEHYFNHLMFNPSGNKFLFFHLWVSMGGKRHSRIFVAYRDGQNIKLVNNSGSISHYNWISNNKIILYSLIKETNKYSYAIFNVLDGRVKYFGKNVPYQDGHPTLIRENSIFITDTYPDICSKRNLLSYNILEDKTKTLARFDSPQDYAGEFRCDLHPRISHDEKMICVDRIRNNKRCISLTNIDKLKL